MVVREWQNFIWLVFLCVLLVACGDGLTVEEVTQALQETNQTYLVYQQGNSLYAVDPRAPSNVLPIEEAEPTLDGVIVSSSIVSSALDPSFRLRINDNLLYAKNGNIWRVNVRLDSGLNKHRVSSETGANSICSVSSFNYMQPSSLVYEYVLPGEDRVCFSNGTTPVFGTSVELYNPPDDVVKQVSIHADSGTDPQVSTGTNRWPSSSAVTPFYDYNSRPEGMRGALVYDSAAGNLLWFDNGDFSVAGVLVASNVATMIRYLWSSEELYLEVNGELYRYRAGANSLGPSLASLPANASVQYHNRALYVLNNGEFLRLDIGATSAEVIARNPAYSELERLWYKTNDYFIAYSSQPEGYKLISIRVSDGELTELVEIINGQPQSYPTIYTDKEVFYYWDGLAGQSGYVSADGAVKEIFGNLKLEARIHNNIFNEFQPRISHLLLSRPGMDGQRSLVSFDTQTRNQTALGEYSGGYLSGQTVSNNNNALVRLYSNGVNEILFLQLNRENSLTQVSDNTTSEPLRLVSNRYQRPNIVSVADSSSEFIVNSSRYNQEEQPEIAVFNLGSAQAQVLGANE